MADPGTPTVSDDEADDGEPAAEDRSVAPTASTSWWRRPAVVIAGVAVGAAIIGGLAGFGVSSVVAAPGGSCDAVRVASAGLPSIVTIHASSARGSGSGSGAVLTADGLIVTNDHVLTPALPSGAVRVTLMDGEILRAEIVGRDPQTDLAVLRVERDGALQPLAFAPSDELDIGQPVVALGAPLGLSNTVTAGIVSALGRSVTLPTSEGTTVITGMVQTDAAINPGNSGGALVDCDGRLVGINTAISTVPNSEGVGGVGSVGIGFAVPADTVRAITDELIDNGRVDHPSFGMTTATLSAAAAAQFGVPPGVVVTGTVPGGSADVAGLQAGDLITRLDGHASPTEVTVARVAVTAAAGDEVEVEFVRDGRQQRTTVTLQPNPAP
ncbi:trypsin-like peptidase domain-containing protein [Microbacterium sp. NEAU-LLC]|uniref:Trypsin-like peptidase domain-containing protein n=1 Tax=Microbacterium helvum TaxID=2773713 RepID=A0ABR8NKC6_9MICO|nr:trypsin-like peptidase domain-containing protein [Microbacterium helvum]MBD3941134.1 trypsin-like peptidase domain-containing protein [Microbacterium helvum]